MKIEGLGIAERLKMLQGVQGIERPETNIGVAEGSTGSEKLSFGDFLAKQFSEANAHGVAAENSIQRSLRGEELNPHNTILAVQKASISLTLMMSVKERLERAYQELIRMQIG